LRGVKAAKASRSADVKLQKKTLKQQTQQFFWEQLTKISEPSRLAQLAAFSYGAIAAYESHTDKFDDKGVWVVKGLPSDQLAAEAFRQGLEAIIALELCKVQSPGLSASTSQAFGCAILTAIGLQIPLSSIEVLLAGSKDPSKTFGISDPDFITNFNKWFASIFPWAT
jgi:hypothetical protein